jgi:uncharacterized protein (TIGR00369 family)
MSTEMPMQSATIHWADPATVGAAAYALDGMSWLSEVRDGRLPMDPYTTMLGLRLESVEVGTVVLAVEVQQLHLNLASIVHGGFLSTLMDQACGLAVRSTQPVGKACLHAQANYRFLRPGLPNTTLRCTARVIKSGRALSITSAEVHDVAGILLATGEGTHATVDLARLAP